MPPGTPYHSFLVEYPYIRVDDFTSIKNDQARIHLLTHAHSDHIVGLQAKTFSQQVICSHDTKELLLRHEVYKERHLHEQELRAEKRKTYSHLKVDPLVGEHGQIYYQGSKDLLVRRSRSTYKKFIEKTSRKWSHSTHHIPYRLTATAPSPLRS